MEERNVNSFASPEISPEETNTWPERKKTIRKTCTRKGRKLAGCCEHGNEPSGFIKCGVFTDKLRNCLLASQNRLHSMELFLTRWQNERSWTEWSLGSLTICSLKCWYSVFKPARHSVEHSDSLLISTQSVQGSDKAREGRIDSIITWLSCSKEAYAVVTTAQ